MFYKWLPLVFLTANLFLFLFGFLTHKYALKFLKCKNFYDAIESKGLLYYWSAVASNPDLFLGEEQKNLRLSRFYLKLLIMLWLIISLSVFYISQNE